jgi:hypothetical protein
MYKHLSCAAFKIKLTTGSSNAGTYEKLHDQSQIRLWQKAGVCASALIVRRHRFLCQDRNSCVHQLTCVFVSAPSDCHHC